MKLLEVAPDFVRSQVGTLMTILQYLESKTKPGTVIPFANVSRLMNNAGFAFNYGAFKDIIDNNEALRSMISNHDENSITLGPSEETDQDMGDETLSEPNMDLSQPNEPSEPEVDIGDGRNPERATVDKMAARASRF